MRISTEEKRRNFLNFARPAAICSIHGFNISIGCAENSSVTFKIRIK